MVFTRVTSTISIKRFLIALVLGTIFTFFVPTQQVIALTYTSGEDWSSGSSLTLDNTVDEGHLELQAAGTWGARSWRTPDLTLSIGTAFASDGTDIYVLRGVGDVLFWKYSPTTDTWTTLPDLPRGAYYGADIDVLDGYVYILFGGFQKSFARYSIADNTWTMLEDVPDLVFDGGSLTNDGTNLYALRGNNTQDFYKYDVANDTWSPMNGMPATGRRGADLVRVGNYIYTPRGNNTATMYRYDISANTWSTMANAPGLLSDDMDISTDGETIFVTRQLGTTSFYSYDIATNTWATLTSLPAIARYGGAIYHSGDGYVYVFQGNGQTNFWKYDIDANSFVGPEDIPATVTTGSDMVYYSGYMYVLRGSNTNTLYRYDPTNNSWLTLAVAPVTFTDDTKGVAAGTHLYFFRGNNTANFYRYTPSTDSWTTLTDAPSLVRFGGSLVYPGTGDYLYATRGATTQSFWRYSISGNTWDDASVADLPTDAEASYGSRMVTDGTNIYYLAGSGISRWYRYTIGANTWTELAAAPFAPFYGTDIAYANGKVLALAGWYKNELWEYTLSTNIWRKLQSSAGYLAQDVGHYAGASIEYDGSGSFYVTRGNGRTNMLVYTPSVDNFVAAGSWISPAEDLGYVSSWTNFNSTVTTPSDSSITFETRTSANASDWSSWATVSGGTIASVPAKYIQVKATLLSSSNGADTPQLQDFTIEYSGDTTPPANPSEVDASSQQVGGAALTSGETYRHIAPYFTWEEVIDAETAVDGYYVYFGPNEVADPESAGEYSTANEYQVSKPLATGTYYLRFKTKDTAGNVSDASTLFTYVYAGISPAQSLLVGTTAEFTGTAENINIANDQIKLESRTDGFWLEETLSTAPGGMQYGAKTMAYVSESNQMYALRGNNSGNFYGYNVTTDTWTTLTNAPANVRMGGGVIEGPSGYLYAFQGNNTTAFWRYNIDDNTWSDTDAVDTPLTVYYGGSLIFDGDEHIYALRGNNDDAFWRYSTTDDSWETLANTDFGATTNAATNTVYIGGDLAIDQSNQLVYAIQGNSYDGFSVYDINTNTWTVLPDVPQLPNLGATIEYVSDTNSIYYTPGNSSDKMYRYDVVAETWSTLANTPFPFYYGAASRHIGDYIYAMPGGNSTSLYKYHIEKNSWMIPNRGLFSRVFQGTAYLNESYGADILKGDGDNFYITRGNFADEFVKWNSVTGTITKLKATPVGLYNGSSLVYDSTNQKIYLTGGVYVQKFYQYDIATNTWSEVTTDPPPANTDYGSSMVYDGSRYIYLNRGAATNGFYRYDTQGTPGTRWSAMAIAPVGLGYGAELLLKDGYIYTVRGQNVNNNQFYRYDIAANTWSDVAVADMAIDVYNDGWLADGNNGYFYAAKGENEASFYKYSVANNTWTQIGNAPVRMYIGAGGESNGSNKIFMIPGAATGAYADAVYTYVMQTDTSGFQEEGTYTSQTHDLTEVYKWAGLTVDYTSTTGSDFEVLTRSSDDSSTWSSWTAVSAEKISGTEYSYKINSPPARYLQVSFEMTSANGISSGVINDYTINYYKDETAPTNPETEGLSSYSNSEGSAPIVSGSWYGYATPHFDWPDAEATYGASDTSTGSGVDGYYVYFGTDPEADPATDGSLQTTTAYTASGLVHGSTYYLRIKTKDDADNVSAAAWQPFTYKYDGEAPTAPGNLNADPSGYSATNSFDFSWDVATSSGAAVTDYCYKTGATTGQYATDQCQSGTSVTGIPSHKVGTNTFSVRTKDAAGNYSAYSTTSYYYVDSNNAPAPPTNLQVTPTSSTSNSFAFSWDPPAVGTYYGSLSNLSYYYSVNALPTAQSTTATSLRSLIAGAYATLPGDNVFYIVTKDEAGNINYNNYASVTFTANTSAPGIPLNIDIADVSVKSTSSWKIALSWEAPSESASVSHYAVFRSIDGTNFSSIGSSGGISFVDVGLTQQLYYYKVKACDNTNNCGAFSEVVSLLPDGKFTTAAEMIAEPVVSEITTKKATISWTTSRTADSKIAFGTSSGSYFDEEVANSLQVTSHILKLTNLTPGTTYYYVTKWTDEDGNTGVSDEKSFVTAPPPSTEEPVAKSVSLDTALIEFTSRNASRVRIYYGETSAFGGVEDIVTGTGEGTHTVQLTELKDGTKYFFKINSYDSEGEEYEGEIHSFTTLPRPKISNIKVNQVKGTAESTLLMTWSSNTEISSIVTYYPLSNPAAAKDEVNITLKSGKHQMILTGLAPQTTYAVLIKGKDQAGNEAVGEIQQVTTSADTRPPVISDLKVEGEIIGTGDEATAQLVVSFKTDEPGTAQIEFGEGSGTTYSQKTQEDSSLTGHHLVVISELTPSKVYHLRALSKDQFNNQAASVDKVVITPKATENALDLVITSMSSIFGFIGQ